MRISSTTQKVTNWWYQFPTALRTISRVRLLASIGAGGVIYLTPLVFNKIELSATQIGSGLAAAAFVGTISRLIAGRTLDKGTHSSFIIRWAAFLAIFADIWLLNAQSFFSYVTGQLILGAAAGLYWPAVEVSVPSSCENFPSSKGFALARSADALGTCIGALIGSLMALIGEIRSIYLVDTICMIFLLVLLVSNPLKDKRAVLINQLKNNQTYEKKSVLKNSNKWFPQLIPILGLSLLATGIFSLLQSALPLDLVKGGVSRPPLSEGWSSTILAFQLGLLLIFQWPVGRWLSLRNPKFGLTISMSNFCIGCFLLGISTLWEKGLILALLAQFPLAFALAAFLPTATEAVIQITPLEYRGVSMALFSQCFAISALVSPLLAGRVFDINGNGMLIWITTCIGSLTMLPLINSIREASLKAKT